MTNPYLLDAPAVISFSGGRTSGMMLWHILQAHCGALPGELCRSKGRASNLDSDSDGDRIDKALWVHGMRNQRRMGEYDPPKTWDAWRRIEDATKEE